MDKCRICLGNKKNLRCIFDAQDDHSYAFMISSVSNVKIMENDGITDKICLGCRKKLKEAYDFKSLIERSDAALQSYSNGNKINFNDLKELKIKLEIEQEWYVPKTESNIDEYFKDGESLISYNNTTIKKVEPCDAVVKSENGPLSVLDFLNTIDDDCDNHFGDNDMDVDYEPVTDDGDDEYLLPLAQRKKQKNDKRKSKKTKASAASKDRKSYNNKDKLKKVSKPIKPVFLSDIRVLPTKIAREKKATVPKKYNRIKREMCNYCGKITTSLKIHLLRHTGERSYKCDICGKGFFTEKCLHTHEKRHVQAKDRSLKCELCVATFGTKDALKSHMISHSDEKKFICNVCSKPFKRRAAMHRHQKAHNVTNKNIKCELCNMSFFTNSGLNHHMRVHTGERPYNCEICSQPYSYKHDFNRHCLKKHGVFLKRRYVNVMNEEVLKRERALMRDLMLKMHGFVNDGENINPFEGPQGPQAFDLAIKALKAKQIPIDFNI